RGEGSAPATPLCRRRRSPTSRTNEPSAATHGPGPCFALGIQQVAGDRVKEIGLHHGALQAAVLVDDHSDVNGRVHEEFKRFQNRCCFVYNHCRPGDRANIERATLEAEVEKVLLSHYAYNLVNRTLACKEMRMRTALDGGENFFPRFVEIN